MYPQAGSRSDVMLMGSRQPEPLNKTGDPRAAHPVNPPQETLSAFGAGSPENFPNRISGLAGQPQEHGMTYVRSYRRSVRRGLARVVYVRPHRRRR